MCSVRPSGVPVYLTLGPLSASVVDTGMAKVCWGMETLDNDRGFYRLPRLGLHGILVIPIHEFYRFQFLYSNMKESS